MRLSLAFAVFALALVSPPLLSGAAGDGSHSHDHGSKVSTDVAGLIDGRQGLMSYIGANMRVLSQMSKDSAQFDRQYVRSVGQAIAVIAAAYPHMFPNGSGKEAGRTEADAKIFADRQGFESKASDLLAAGRLVATAADAAELAEHFRELSGTCASCHTVYRSR